MTTDTILDKLLIEKIGSNINEIANLRDKMNRYQDIITQLFKDNAEFTKAYQDACSHEVSTRETVSHMEGGYDHVSETQYKDVCTRCRKVTSSKLVRGTYA